MVTLAKIRKHCASLPGATSDIKWGQDLCYSVGGKYELVAAKLPKSVRASLGA